MIPRHVLLKATRRRVNGLHSPRYLATEAPAASQSSQPEKSTNRSRIRTAIVLNRAPILTPDLTPFETAYYAYNARLGRALQNPFPADFYFKSGSPLEATFNVLEQQRESEAFGPGFGEPPKDSKGSVISVDSLLATEEFDIPASREHASDKSGDTKDLNRLGPRNLYLLVRSSKGEWRFPQGETGVKGKEFLHQTVTREMKENLGDRMDAWLVSKQPIAHYGDTPETDVFFYKAHILSGQVKPTKSGEFAWLSKEEIQSKVQPAYWDAVKDILSDH